MTTMSMRTRLLLYSAAFLAVVIALAALAGSQFLAINGTVADLGQTRIGTTRVLGEMGDQLVEFRLAETYRALATDPRAVANEDQAAAQHRRAIEALLTEYVGLLGGPAAMDQDYVTLRRALADYMAAHDAWVKADVGGTDHGPASPDSSLHTLYQSADAAVDRTIRHNTTIAVAQTETTFRLVDRTMAILVLGVITASLFVVVMSIVARRLVMKPLADITDAMVKLAGGDRELRVPQLHRSDEIGQLAKAFDVFRANARALEEAQAATQAAQEQAQLLARHDALTGLPNRRVFAAELEAALDRVRDGGAVFSVFVIDIDRFKQINDLHGHAAGDLVLCEIADRLRNTVRAGDTVARLGGDEFAVIAPGDLQGHPDVEIALARRLIDAAARPIPFGEGQIETAISVGIAMVPSDATDAEGVQRAADIAMYRSKRDGRGLFRFFEQSMDAELRAEAALEVDLKRAVASGEIMPHYQPLIDFRSNRIQGFEVLARWHHPERGWLPPDVFIPLAERLGLISQLTTAIIRQACRDGLNWGKSIQLSVNVSAFLLKDSALPTQLLTILQQEGFPPARLEIEITEKALLTDIGTAKQIVAALQAIGIKVSLDNFGTGYSSLYHLRELKFDKVKIDRSFVQSMQENPESEKVVDAVLGLARSVGMPAIAEGIENPEVKQLLADKGCEYGQGFLFGKPMPADEVAAAISAPVAGAVRKAS